MDQLNNIQEKKLEELEDELWQNKDNVLTKELITFIINSFRDIVES